MFEGLANFLQGKGWTSNAQLDEEKRKQQQASQPAPVKSPLTVGTLNVPNSVQMGQVQTPQLVLQKPQQLPQQQLPQQQAPQQAQPKTFLQNINDFVAQRNDALFGGITRNTANIVNSFATGFNGEETQKRTEDFLRTIGQSDANGQSRLAQGTDKNSTAGRLGQAIGGTERLVAETVPTILLPAGATLKATQGLSTGKRIATVAGVDAGIGGLFGAGSSMAQGNDGQDVLRDTAIGAGVGGVLGAGTAVIEPYLQKLALRATQRSNPAQVATSVKATILRDADDIERAAQEAPISELGKIDDGISSPAIAETKRTAAQDTANQLRQQADQIPEPQLETPQVSTPDINNPVSPLTLQKATPEQLLARAEAGDPEAAVAIQKQFDEASQAIDADTVAPTPDAPVSEVIEPAQPIDNILESPITAQSREIAEATPPVSQEAFQTPVSDVEARLAANNEARLQGTPDYKGALSDLDKAIKGTRGNSAASFEVSRLKRALNSSPTDNEIIAAIKKLESNYIGKQLPQGEVVGVAFGKVRVKTPEGDIISIEVPKTGVTKGEAVNYLRNEAKKRLDPYVKVARDEVSDQPVTRQVDELTSYEGAPDRAAVDEYKRRIANGDELEPVVVMRDSQGKLGIEDGKHRFQAYQEMGVKDIPTIDRTPNPLSSIEAEGRQLIDSANATLATEGKTVGDLVQKLARANETGVPAQLTRAEQTAFQQLNDAVNSAQETAMRSGLITPETGNISQYLPTGAADNVLPTQLSDIANQDFNYSRRRTNALSDKQLKEGGENAFLDYYLRGRGSENLDDATIDAQNATRAEVIAREEMFNIPREGGTPDSLDITPEVKTQMEEAAIDAADARRAQINAERAQSVGDKATYKEQAEIAREKGLESAAKNLNALEKSVLERAALIKASNLSAAEKAKRYSALYDHLESVIAKKTYIQPFVTSNVLGQVPGRVADQVSKAIASTTDNLTSLLSQAGARGSFKRGAGRSLQTDSQTLRKVVKNTDAYNMFNQNKLETQLNKKAGLGNPWTRGITRVTQAGSRVKAPIKDTVSYFASKAQAEGLTSADDISRYVLEASRTPEWEKVYGLFYSSRNRFSGVPSFLPDANGNLTMIQTPLDPLFNSIERGLQKAVDMIPGVASKPGLRKNLKTAIRQATLGFPRVIANQGYQAINTASLGAIDLVRAARTTGTDDLSRLKKAVLIKQGLEGAQTGAGAYALGGAMGAAGLVSGAYPEDTAEQQQWQDEGKQEYSINIGGKWVDPFRYAGLAGLPLMLGGLIGSGKSTDLGGLAVGVAGALGQNFGVGAIQDITKFLSGDTPQGQSTSLAMNFIGQFVPGLSQLNSLANASDENQRNVKSQDWGQEFLNRGANKIPGLRQTLPEKTDSFGNEMKNPGFLIAGALPIKGGDTGVSDDPAQAEVSRLQSLGLDAYPKGVDGSANNYTLKDGEDTAIKLTDAQQNDLNNAIKDGKQAMATTLMDSEAYQSASDEEKAKMLKSIYTTNSAGIASEWAKANGIENAKQDARGISDKLDADKASALAVADAMDTDTRDKWLEDKNNAVNYNVGKYENAIANGTLTARDDNLENSASLHYKAIASQVNARLPYWTSKLEEQYKNTSKKELYAMSPSNPVRKALLALDEARAGAGVSLKSGDHSENKYGSGAGSGGGKNFSFATTSAVNADKSGFTDPNIKSGFNAKLVKPLGIGEASEKVKRKITVKRGVSL